MLKFVNLAVDATCENCIKCVNSPLALYGVFVCTETGNDVKKTDFCDSWFLNYDIFFDSPASHLMRPLVAPSPDVKPADELTASNENN